MVICDAHAHIGTREESEIRKKHRINTFLCAVNPPEAALLETLCQNNRIFIPTYGLHPWYAGQFSVAAMLPWLKKGRLLGEIGMDSEWCKVPLGRQKKIFMEQLGLAESWNMPVILHTKGQEREVLNCIRPFTPPVLVHWYSDEAHLEGYIEKDCFFSVGPDAPRNAAVRKVAQKVPLERLLVESDGMAAVRWALAGSRAFPAPPPDSALPGILSNSIEFIARAKGTDTAAVARQLVENFMYLANYRE